MSKLGITYGVVKLYFKGWSEWYINYLVSFLLFSVMAGSVLVYSLFGVSLLFNVGYLLVMILLTVHVALGLVNIANDYVYEKGVKKLYIELTILIALRLLLECLV